MSSEPEHAVHLDKVSLSLKQGCGVWGVSGPDRSELRTEQRSHAIRSHGHARCGFRPGHTRLDQ